MRLPNQFSGLSRSVAVSHEAGVIASWKWGDIFHAYYTVTCCRLGPFGKPVCTEHRVPAWQNCRCESGGLICHGPVSTQG